MPYELGRQFQRFHDDHPELLTMLIEEDWRWIIEVCSKTRSQPGEERHPDEWTGSTESISSVLPRWRSFMRAKHPYKGFMIERSTIGRRARCKDKRCRIPGRNPDDDSKPEGQDLTLKGRQWISRKVPKCIEKLRGISTTTPALRKRVLTTMIPGVKNGNCGRKL
ncbi:hypothetical protein FOXYSP1_14439 [Fusarium oxysporum f. sp. phaseoli]